ncbi:hypothetical protein RND71_023450 [Anisodus tanguticus]|uniref:Uncharacterized protein n=1 Tax=Anisodus tanguticus TaxID=243964 RepID=A0AAE1RUE9_9SOLA|nr:hypothetical protein RND71_023450 [Anisodus tanguticus]
MKNLKEESSEMFSEPSRDYEKKDFLKSNWFHMLPKGGTSLEILTGWLRRLSKRRLQLGPVLAPSKAQPLTVSFTTF